MNLLTYIILQMDWIKHFIIRQPDNLNEAQEILINGLKQGYSYCSFSSYYDEYYLRSVLDDKMHGICVETNSMGEIRSISYYKNGEQCSSSRFNVLYYNGKLKDELE